MSYQYTPVTRDPLELRLVEIDLEFDKEDSISLHLVHTPHHLEHASLRAVYFCLSYTWNRPSPFFPEDWNDPTSTITILVNGLRFEIRHNLFQALKSIKKEFEDLRNKHPNRIGTPLLWVDAISINQDDVSEKNWMIPKMTDIYLKSECTIVWLGPADDTSDLALASIKELSTSWETGGWKDLVGNADGERLDDEETAVYTTLVKTTFFDSNLEKFWPAVEDLMKRAWFTRAWIIQEACVSRNISILCGRESISWKCLMDVVMLLDRHAQLYGIWLPSDLVKEGLHPMKLTEDLFPFISVHNRLTYWKAAKANGKHLDLLDNLGTLRNRDAKDKRDKIYSAFGMSNPEQIIEVDYKLPVKDVYVALARHLLEKQGNFKTLGYCHFPPNMEGLCTWTPDWSKDILYAAPLAQSVRGILESKRFFSVSGDSKPNVFFADKGHTLLVKAQLLDAIVFCSSKYEKGYLERDDIKESFLEEFLETRRSYFLVKYGCEKWLLSASRTPNTKFCGDDWTFKPEEDYRQFFEMYKISESAFVLDEFTRTLCTDRLQIAKKDEVQRLDFQKNPWEIIRENGGIRAFEYSSAYKENRIFAVSQTHLFVLAPDATQPGDIIAIVEGSEYPFVLRSFGDDYQFIGECYVHHIMDGEAWKPDTEDFSLQDIRIV